MTDVLPEYREAVAGTFPPWTTRLPSATNELQSNRTSHADQPSVHYKVQGDSVAKRSSGAWGARGTSSHTYILGHSIDARAGTMPHLMPNGQDFMSQLKKQLATLDQNKPSSSSS